MPLETMRLFNESYVNVVFVGSVIVLCVYLRLNENLIIICLKRSEGEHF